MKWKYASNKFKSHKFASGRFAGVGVDSTADLAYRILLPGVLRLLVWTYPLEAHYHTIEGPSSRRLLIDGPNKELYTLQGVPKTFNLDGSA